MASTATESPASPVRSRAMIDAELRTMGATGLVLGTAPCMAGLACGGDIVAAVVTARLASTVPKPDPLVIPPFRPKTVLSVIALRTCRAVRLGNSDRISAAIPATIALAAVVLLSVRKPDGLAATTSSPAAVRVT